MVDVKVVSSLNYLCSLLSELGVYDLCTETLVQAKLDSPGVSVKLWRALHDLVLLQLARFPSVCPAAKARGGGGGVVVGGGVGGRKSGKMGKFTGARAEGIPACWIKSRLEGLWSCPDGTVPLDVIKFVKYYVCLWGYPVREGFFSLPFDARIGGRELLLALAWLVSHCNLFSIGLTSRIFKLQHRSTFDEDEDEDEEEEEEEEEEKEDVPCPSPTVMRTRLSAVGPYYVDERAKTGSDGRMHLVHNCDQVHKCALGHNCGLCDGVSMEEEGGCCGNGMEKGGISSSSSSSSSSSFSSSCRWGDGERRVGSLVGRRHKHGSAEGLPRVGVLEALGEFRWYPDDMRGSHLARSRMVQESEDSHRKAPQVLDSSYPSTDEKALADQLSSQILMLYRKLHIAIGQLASLEACCIKRWDALTRLQLELRKQWSLSVPIYTQYELLLLCDKKAMAQHVLDLKIEQEVQKEAELCAQHEASFWEWMDGVLDLCSDEQAPNQEGVRGTSVDRSIMVCLEDAEYIGGGGSGGGDGDGGRSHQGRVRAECIHTVHGTADRTEKTWGNLSYRRKGAETIGCFGDAEDGIQSFRQPGVVAKEEHAVRGRGKSTDPGKATRCCLELGALEPLICSLYEDVVSHYQWERRGNGGLKIRIQSEDWSGGDGWRGCTSESDDRDCCADSTHPEQAQMGILADLEALYAAVMEGDEEEEGLEGGDRNELLAPSFGPKQNGHDHAQPAQDNLRKTQGDVLVSVLRSLAMTNRQKEKQGGDHQQEQECQLKKCEVEASSRGGRKREEDWVESASEREPEGEAQTEGGGRGGRAGRSISGAFFGDSAMLKEALEEGSRWERRCRPNHKPEFVKGLGFHNRDLARGQDITTEIDR
ncbi:hypothetical protein CBR_g37136 [Chara braunii]|nr:hypothetical protein CBR_g37136 [Chara braunii]|eukprot:GBG83423.1 hypothetical protein CBR_g37136 [Chara braunii]